MFPPLSEACYSYGKHCCNLKKQWYWLWTCCKTDYGMNKQVERKEQYYCLSDYLAQSVRLKNVTTNINLLCSLLTRLATKRPCVVLSEEITCFSLRIRTDSFKTKTRVKRQISFPAKLDGKLKEIYRSDKLTKVRNLLCEVWGSHSGADEDYHLVSSDAACSFLSYVAIDDLNEPAGSVFRFKARSQNCEKRLLA